MDRPGDAKRGVQPTRCGGDGQSLALKFVMMAAFGSVMTKLYTVTLVMAYILRQIAIQVYLV